ncbi:MAG: biotin--[acetyl-CoA-carboxylase] ligase [Steroidobacteraceae bacterium]
MSPPAVASLVQRVFQRLSVTELRSGEQLAGELAVTRAAVWKAVQQLRELGVPLDAQASRGYRLANGYGALDRDAIMNSLRPDDRQRVSAFEVLWSVPSTNDYLLGLAPPEPGCVQVAVAERQTAGRGRRGRAWLAPPGGAICLSLSWTFAELPKDVAALALAIGVATQRALKSCDAAGIRLKWPNDLVTARGKLGGILLELRAEATGVANVVIGVGINVALQPKDRAAIESAGGVADDLLATVEAGQEVSRNRVVGALLTECMAGLLEFQSRGFAEFHALWRELDCLRGAEVIVVRGDETFSGLARGTDSHGQLLVETPNGRIMPFSSGEVSVRRSRGEEGGWQSY